MGERTEIWKDIKGYEAGLRGPVVFDFEKEVIEDYKNGYVPRQLEKKYKSNWSTIRKILVDNNVEIITLSERKTIYEINKESLAKDFESGMRNVDIARKYNTNRSLIGTYRYKHKRGELI